ncbi:MAG: ATP-binding protein, partial [Desulfoferrobacter sp.]
RVFISGTGNKRLAQVFSNLLENLLRYADAPGCLKVWQHTTEKELILRLQDSGPGVPEESLISP